jgi:hypothetical protein
MPDLVGRTDGLIPSLDHRFVHVVDRSERAAEQSQRAAMPKVRIRGEEDRHPGQTCMLTWFMLASRP